jgi:hypothetical protein
MQKKKHFRQTFMNVFQEIKARKSHNKHSSADIIFFSLPENKKHEIKRANEFKKNSIHPTTTTKPGASKRARSLVVLFFSITISHTKKKTTFWRTQNRFVDFSSFLFRLKFLYSA